MHRWKSLAILLGLGLIGVSRASGQDGAPRTIRGRVLAAADSAPLAEATVVALVPGAAAGLTASNGRVSLLAPPGDVLVAAARIGFAPETLSVESGIDTVTFRLRAAAVELDPLVVAAEPTITAASSRAIQELNIRLRPTESAQELLRLAPGLVIAQHAGGGKAEQIFLRGFDADHGTDVAVSVDGVPVNMVSHAHGQGYADLHFLIPEIVARGEVRKGPYDARDGNLATAGAVEFRTLDRVERGTLDARAGTFGTGHATAIVPFGGAAGETGGYVAAAGRYTDGPVERGQGYRRANGFAKLTTPVGASAELVASGGAFASRWDASGQIPARAVRAGLITRYGSIDDSEGGRTSRYDLSLVLRSAAGGPGGWDIRAYGVKYGFELFSNFTFFLDDSINGDGIRQRDERWIAGLDAQYRVPTRLAGLRGRLTAGAGGRADWADVRLDGQVRRRLLDERVNAGVRERQTFVWVRQDLALAPGVGLHAGLRADHFRFAVSDRLVGVASALPHASGTRSEARLSPRVNLSVRAAPGLSLYGNLGSGFHSNDARSVILAPDTATVLPRAFGSELGARYVWAGGTLAAALWRLDLESELVFVGDEGTTEASGRTRRRGLDLEARARILPWVWLDADLNLSRGRFRDAPPGADYIPLAPTLTSTGGLTVRDAGAASGGLRWRHVSGRPANEDGLVRAEGSTVFELFGRWSLTRVDLLVAVDNLFGVEWNEAQFATTSRLRDEVSSRTERHFTPGPGRALQVGLEHRF
jgi:outer membrane receptor protein involved in Fe transport